MIEIAIDGTAASGKGTLAKKLAYKYSYAHLDTGLLYRKVAKELIIKKKYTSENMDLSRSAPFFNVRLFFCFNSEFYDRGFFFEKKVFGVGTLPQAPFFYEKTRFWSWNVAAGAFSK